VEISFWSELQPSEMVRVSEGVHEKAFSTPLQPWDRRMLLLERVKIPEKHGGERGSV
jgi:hypothetical protein